MPITSRASPKRKSNDHLVNWSTLWSRVLPEKLTVTQLFKKFHLLCNPKFHYRVQENPSLVPILSQMNPVHTFPPYFPKIIIIIIIIIIFLQGLGQRPVPVQIHSNIIIPSMSRSSKWSLPFRLSNQSIVLIFNLSHACYMPRPSNPPCDHPIKQIQNLTFKI